MVSRNKKIDIGSTDAGMVAFVFDKVPVWPPIQSGTVFEKEISDGKLILSAEPPGVLRLLVISTSGGNEYTLVNVRSCPLRMENGSAAMVLVSWRGKFGKIRVNGTTVGTDDFFEEVPREFIPNGAPAHEPALLCENFSVENSKQIVKRRSKFDAISSKPTYVSGGAAHYFESLRAEINQVTDVLKLIEAGSLDHVRGLSSHLRLLVATGKPLPLLQLCAAVYGLPLLLYTSARPTLAPPASEKLGLQLSMPASPEPRPLFFNPVDLDVWLGFRAMTIGDTVISHRVLLKRIADTLGAHVDVDILPAVFVLRTEKVALSEKMPIDLMGQYVQKAAAAVLPLCRATLQHREQVTTPNLAS